ncbi:cytochrome P450 [Pilatotrama ljubarskyi]|nr:cytochrome P450 [Pilatotrama ljubarskyi]
MTDLNVPYTVLAILVAAYVAKWWLDPLRSIPTVGGSSLPVLSYLSGMKWIRHGKELIQEGYEKYNGAVFKVAMLDQWLVIITGPKLIEDLRKRPDGEVSFLEAAADFVQTKYTLGPEVHYDPYHVDIIRDKLTRTLPTILPDVVDELRVAIHDHIPAKEGEWVGVNAMEKTRQIIARASNRVFVGLPACRNEQYLDLAVNFTKNVVKDRAIINLFPTWIKPIVGHLLSNTTTNVRRAAKILKPIIDERRRCMEEYGDDWSDKPNDMLQWVMEEAIARNKGSDEAIVQRILLVNFAAIHTSSNSITHAIYHLADHPEYIQALREEIEPIVKEEGWTKNAMSKMWKLDSFLKESQRYNGINVISVMRKGEKDITLSNGTFIPRGTLIVAAALPMHRDDAVYMNAEVFDPWRFSRMREADGEGTKHQFVNTSVEYVAFGHGKHACPGRFFAANELKAMLAYMIVNYDMKLPDGQGRPENLYWGATVVPNPSAEVLFRKRQTVIAV